MQVDGRKGTGPVGIGRVELLAVDAGDVVVGIVLDGFRPAADLLCRKGDGSPHVHLAIDGEVDIIEFLDPRLVKPLRIAVIHHGHHVTAAVVLV